MKHLSVEDVRERSVKAFGLSTDNNIESPEFLAAALRRAASAMCPVPNSKLIKAVCETVSPLSLLTAEEVKEFVQQVLEDLIANGDLIEKDEVMTSIDIAQRGRVLYLRPPSFIKRQSNSIFLIGISPENTTVLPPEIEQRIDYYQHVRRLSVRHNENLSGELKKIGLIEIPLENWDRRNSIPETETPAKHIERVKANLKGNPGNLHDIQILNPYKNVRFYTHRWEAVRNQTGFFVARRPQAFGNDLWCYVELRDGQPVTMLDFPVLKKELFGRDEAWHLQMAIDAERGKPQEFTVVPLSDLYKKIKFYSPVPSWAQRRWDNISEPDSNEGCLFAYKFKGVELAPEVSFIVEKLWMTEKN